ncbi:23840_t:CDS:2, partial [Gigaspora rosea]
QGHGISLEDMQKAIQNALVQQKTENQTLVKKVTELESQMAKQTQVPAPQTVEPVRQSRGPPSSLQTKEDLAHSEAINVSARIDRVEEGINETCNAVNQLTNQFQKVYIEKCDICGEMGHSKKNCPNIQIARSNFNRSAYFKPLTPINFQNTHPVSDNEEDGYDEENNRWTVYDTSEKKTVTLKDKENKTVTIIRNFVHIDNGEPEPMLFLVTWEDLCFPTYNKNPIVKESPKDTESSKTLDSDLSSEELKKNA